MDLRTECEQLVAEECVGLGVLKAAALKKQTPDNPACKPFFMHGVSHPIGLDVHDATYNHLKIAPGWVMTCEPAIYVREEGFGVRLENTILSTIPNTVRNGASYKCLNCGNSLGCS